MKTARREFLKILGAGIGGWSLFSAQAKEAVAAVAEKVDSVRNLPADEVARDEDFWFTVQQAFAVDRSVINLNNGGVHPASIPAMDALHRYLDFANGAPVYNSWRFLRPRKELIRKELAKTFGCSPEEIAITRNVTEALHIPLLGLNLERGDEVLTSTHDYPSMKNALFQREKRDGITVRLVPFSCPPKNLKELTDAFEKSLTSKTRLILICHITNTIGQIFPVRDIYRLARQNGIEVVVDGAHAFGHFDFNIRDLECEIYGANLHKWIMSPIGTGFLYVKKERIPDIWPLFPAPEPLGGDIRKFEHYGTHPEPIIMAISEALAFHHGIGPRRKEARLRYLKDYWTGALSKIPGIRIMTAADPQMSCGIRSFALDSALPSDLVQYLHDEYRILVTEISISEEERWVRVTPSVYTTLRELNTFVAAIKAFSAKSARTGAAA